MQKNTAKETLQAGGTVYGTSLTDCLDPEFASLLRAAGLDFFFVDTEHSPANYHQIQALCRAARGAGIVPLVRVTENVPHLITRALDSGVMGIVVPRVHSSHEACAAVEAMKFTPEGRRGFGMRSTITDFGWTNAVDEMASANRETLAVLQVESREALSYVEEIATTPNLDVLFIGPYDLTISLGIAEQFDHPEFWGAVDRVVSACQKTGVAAGLQSADMAVVREAKNRGARFLLYSNDVSVLFEGYKQGIGALKGAAKEHPR